ncbi:uncharacterized protein EV422DRAFT_272898 [Fimicolochytrium jonesii]|uniref:uncharacterized protein n=1 Tax=Fimicolochytrium jonesii TaxID=1396493 RepID=UPI0022FED8CC|nr:uncharacterized protein EV422DRAFT_272898 [Fimicolochytrium jonesii]KAI8816873.1 hypothetical protein EV422DRAFT_272898 [Fimicolochytrium jonesii]
MIPALYKSGILSLALAILADTAQAAPYIHRRAALTTTTRPLRPSPGNRTHYSTGQPRLGSSTADPTFLTTASGPVTILTPHERATAVHATQLKEANAAWGASQNLSITWKQFPEGSDYAADYVNQVLQACRTGQSSFDVVWVESAYVGALSECLEDVWAWDEAAAGGHAEVVARGGVVAERLVALPAELSFGILLYNSDLLERYGYGYPPDTLNEFEEMATAVLMGERMLENYKMAGWTGPLSSSEDLTSTVAEWIQSIGSSIIDDNGSVTVGTTQVANLLARLTRWLESGIIDPSDVGQSTLTSSLNRFLAGQALFARTTTAHVPGIISSASSAGFDWGIAPVPSDLESGLGVGTAEGWLVGTYRHSQNKAGAMKVVEYLTSQEYQKAKILDLGAAMVGTYPSFLLDRSICQAYGTVRSTSLCMVYSQVSVNRRPVSQAGARYANVTAAVQATVLEVMTGATAIVPALKALDARLRVIMGQPAVELSLEIDDSIVVRPGKKSLDQLGTQLAGLCVVLAVTAVVVVGLRRTQRREIEKQLMAGNPGQNPPQGQAGPSSPGTGDGQPEMREAGSSSSKQDKGKGAEYEALIDKSEKIEI